MERHYFYIPDLRPREVSVQIIGDEFYHLDKVLRLKKGDRVYLLNGKGWEFEGIIANKGPRFAKVEIENVYQYQEPERKIILFQAILKGDRMEILLEKATELGVIEIVPVLTKRCIIKLNPESRNTKLLRWEKVIIQALKQSGNPWLPNLRQPLPLKQALGNYLPQGYSKYVLTQESEEPISPFLLSPPEKIALLIGPEGDFTEEELKLAEGFGFLACNLGYLRLRSETAAICAISLFKYAPLPD